MRSEQQRQNRYRGGRARDRNKVSQHLPTPTPQRLIPFARFLHTCLEDLICQVDLLAQVPYFNAPVFFENRQQVGKVDEIFGTMENFCVSVRLLEPLRAKQFTQGQAFFIEPQKLLPLSRFLPKTAATTKNKKPQPKPKNFKSLKVGSRQIKGGLSVAGHDAMKSRKYKR